LAQSDTAVQRQDAVTRLANAIQAAALQAAADAAQQGLTPAQTQAAVASAVAAVVANSGEDVGVIQAALAQARRNLMALGASRPVLAALTDVREDVASGDIGAGSGPGGGGVPGGNPPSAGGGGGGSDYRPPNT
jgi:uncharacterized membrane protein YgcG